MIAISVKEDGEGGGDSIGLGLLVRLSALQFHLLGAISCGKDPSEGIGFYLLRTHERGLNVISIFTSAFAQTGYMKAVAVGAKAQLQGKIPDMYEHGPRYALPSYVFSGVADEKQPLSV